MVTLSKSMLQIDNINYGFVPAKPIFTNLSFIIPDNGVYALVGDNGSGKTTLFNLISGFLKPGAGNISFKNINISKKKPF